MVETITEFVVEHLEKGGKNYGNGSGVRRPTFSFAS